MTIPEQAVEAAVEAYRCPAFGPGIVNHEAGLRRALAAALPLMGVRRPEDVGADTRRVLENLKAFVGVMFGRGPDASIPETVLTAIGVPIKIGQIMRDLDAVLALPHTGQPVEPCPKCNGAGRVYLHRGVSPKVRCDECDGSGHTQHTGQPQEGLEAALHEASLYGIGATSDRNQKIILEAASLSAAPASPRAEEDYDCLCGRGDDACPDAEGRPLCAPPVIAEKQTGAK